MWGIGNGNGVYGIWVLYCLIRALCLGRLKVQLLSLQESAEDNGSCHLQWRWAADWLEWARYGKYMKMSREEVDCLAASWYVQPAWPVGQTIRANIYTSRPHTHTPRTTYTGVGSYTQSNPLAKFVSVLVIVAVSLSQHCLYAGLICVKRRELLQAGHAHLAADCIVAAKWGWDPGPSQRFISCQRLLCPRPNQLTLIGPAHSPQLRPPIRLRLTSIVSICVCQRLGLQQPSALWTNFNEIRNLYAPTKNWKRCQRFLGHTLSRPLDYLPIVRHFWLWLASSGSSENPIIPSFRHQSGWLGYLDTSAFATFNQKSLSNGQFAMPKVLRKNSIGFQTNLNSILSTFTKLFFLK